MSKPIILIDRFRAKHDTNGNPRRVYRVTVVMPTADGYHRHYFFDEGYAGRSELNKFIDAEYPHRVRVVEQADTDITPVEYKSLAKLADTQRRAHASGKCGISEIGSMQPR